MHARLRRLAAKSASKFTTGIQETQGVGIDIGIETEANSDPDSDPDADKPKQQNIFVHLGATPAQGRLVRKTG
jgi:hypothetical protein